MTTVLVAPAAFAQMTMPPLPQFGPPGVGSPSASVAPLEVLQEAVGTPQVEVICPDARVETAADTLSRTGPHMSRGIKLTLPKVGIAYRDKTIMNTLLIGGLQAALQQCPMQKMNIVGDRYPQNEVGFVDVYGRLTDDGPVIRLVHGDHYLGDMGVWSSVVDEGAEQEQQAAQAVATPPPEVTLQPSEPRFIAPPQPAAPQPTPQVSPDVPHPNFNDNVSDFFGGVGRFIRNVLLIILVVWAFLKREAILRFFYGLTPHPAADAINNAINSGKARSAGEFADVLSVMPDNSIEREVRANQARDLLDRLNAHTRRVKNEVAEEAEYLAEQAKLEGGMTAYLRVKRALEAILKMQGRTR